MVSILKKRFYDSRKEEFLLPVQKKIKKFIEESKKKQTLYANCEGIYSRRQVKVNDTDFLGRFISSTLFNNDECSSLKMREEELSMITKIRDGMIYRARNFDTPGEVHFTVVWVYYFDYHGSNEKAIPLFKVYKTRNSHEAIFLDLSLNTYDGWDDYLDNNVLGKSFLCVPRNGAYVFQPDSESLDLIYIFSDSRLGEKAPLLVKENFMPFCQRTVAPVFSLLKTVNSEMACVVKRFVGFVVDIWESGREMMVRIISLISLAFGKFKRSTEEFLLRASDIFCMLLNKPLKLSQALVHSGDSLVLSLGEDKSIAQLFENFFKELEFDGILLGLSRVCDLMQKLPLSVKIQSFISVVSVIVRIIKTALLWIKSIKEQSESKSAPAVGFVGDASINSLTFENYQATIDNRPTRIAGEIVTNLEEAGNVSCLRIAETAQEKAEQAQNSGPRIEFCPVSSPENTRSPGSVYFFPSTTLAKIAEEFQSIMSDFSIKPRNQVVYDLIEGNRVRGTLFPVNDNSGIAYVPDEIRPS